MQGKRQAAADSIALGRRGQHGQASAVVCVGWRCALLDTHWSRPWC